VVQSYYYTSERVSIEMSKLLSSKDVTYFLAGVVVIFALVLVVIWSLGLKREDQNWLEGALEKTVKKSQLVNTMRVNLLASAEAEKSSVMADTDEASKTFAEESMQASAAVEEARHALAGLLDGARQEMELLREFSMCCEKFQEVDREILPLAVQNTNLKALRLSFIPAGDAVRTMEATLNQLMDCSASSPQALKITRLASQALTAALNIYVLQAPHIADNRDAGMDEIEVVMRGFDAQVNDALSSLQVLVDGAECKPLIDAAWVSYKDFQRINGKIIDLSRQNSNIRSFAISLDQKRKVTAQCQDLLAALQEAVQKNATFKATR
jgi:hypothetical protein